MQRARESRDGWKRQAVVSESDVEKLTTRKVFWRIIPFCFVLYVISYLDRANIGYAALQMNKELMLTSEGFGFASGIFFIGYFLFEVPSNVAMAKLGPRIWMARILVTWGIVSGLTAFVHAAWQLYSLRFLLGVAEAGFFPGIIIYLTYLVPQTRPGDHHRLVRRRNPGLPLDRRAAQHLGHGRVQRRLRL